MEQRMTRAERKAQRKARDARIAVRVFAKQAAKRTVIAQIRAQGLRVSDYSNRDLLLRAEAWLLEHPELIAQARETAAKLGYATVA
jgi:hypothetical protein